MNKLLKAWTVAGSHPEYHFKKIAELKETWPQLYEGIVEVLHQEVKETSVNQAIAEERERVGEIIEESHWECFEHGLPNYEKTDCVECNSALEINVVLDDLLASLDKLKVEKEI